jgi:hypothetical protein
VPTVVAPKTAQPSEFVVALRVDAPLRFTVTPESGFPSRSCSYTVAVPVAALA